MSVIFLSRAKKQRFDTELAEPQLNLLAHSQIIELGIGSQCGGHGICGRDRVKVRPDQASFYSKITEIELGHLSPQEINEGWRLACQCFPEKVDVDLELESE